MTDIISETVNVRHSAYLIRFNYKLCGLHYDIRKDVVLSPRAFFNLPILWSRDIVTL